MNAKAPQPVRHLTGVTAIAAGAMNSCALLVGGTVQCWGLNSSGTIGQQHLGELKVPVPVTGVTTATGVSLGASHACALLVAGTVQCWGDNSTSQLGNGPLAKTKAKAKAKAKVREGCRFRDRA